MKYIVTVRGKLNNEAAQVKGIHDDIVKRISPMGKPMGNTSHQAYLNTQNDREFLAIDVWNNLESIQKLYSDPSLAAEFGKMFEGMPDITVWVDSDWFQF